MNLEHDIKIIPIQNVKVHITKFKVTRYQYRILFSFDIHGYKFEYDLYTFKIHKPISTMVEFRGRGISHGPRFTFAQTKGLTTYLRQNRSELLKRLFIHPDVRFELLPLKPIFELKQNQI